MRFLEAQGYKLKLNVMYQDNVSAIQMERHGKKSSSRRTRHFDVRFFNVKDKLQSNNINVILSYRKYGGGFLYETTTGGAVQVTP